MYLAKSNCMYPRGVIYNTTTVLSYILCGREIERARGLIDARLFVFSSNFRKVQKTYIKNNVSPCCCVVWYDMNGFSRFLRHVV